ncbi:MAG: sodium-dependent transporter, partial [Ilumatobacteraceae bacterium]
MPLLSSIHHPVKSAENPVGRLTAQHPGAVKIGRAGWFAKGVVYVIAGALALSVAAKASGWS